MAYMMKWLALSATLALLGLAGLVHAQPVQTITTPVTRTITGSTTSDTATSRDYGGSIAWISTATAPKSQVLPPCSTLLNGIPIKVIDAQTTAGLGAGVYPITISSTGGSTVTGPRTPVKIDQNGGAWELTCIGSSTTWLASSTTNVVESPPYALVDGPTITPDLSLGTFFTITEAATGRIYANPINAAIGRQFSIARIAGGTVGTFGTAWIPQGGTPLALSTIAGFKDWFGCAVIALSGTTASEMWCNVIGLDYRAPSTASPEVWNAAHKSANITLSNGNLTGTANNSTAGFGAAFGTVALTTHKTYWETVINFGGASSANVTVGLGDATNAITNKYLGDPGGGAATVGYFNDGTVFVNDVQTQTWATYASGARICHAYDPATHKYWTRVGIAGNWNNAAIGSQDPANNIGGYVIPSSVYVNGAVPGFSVYQNTLPDSVVAAFSATGTGNFQGTPPAGFTQP